MGSKNMEANAPGTRYVVTWEEHSAHVTTRLGQLLEDQILVDVTLMCNTHTLKVHKTVLAACSPYFENLLVKICEKQSNQNPLIVLKDMQFSVLKCMIEFMYCGETNVTEDDLGPLLQAARFFQVKGLSAMTKEALGVPRRPENQLQTQTPIAAKPKANGEPMKTFTRTPVRSLVASTNVPPLKNITPTNIAPVRAVPDIPKNIAVRESPGMGAAVTESAELLLSLSDDKNKPKTLLGSPDKNAQDNKRGRPLKRPMNLIFAEKPAADTDNAYKKEAEASRNLLASLQNQMTPEKSAETKESETKKSETITTTTAASTLAALTSTTTTTAVTSAGKQNIKVEQKSDTEATETTTEITADPSSSNYLEVLRDAGLQPDCPILLDSGDGNYITVTEDVLLNIMSGNNPNFQIAEETGGVKTAEEATGEEYEQQVVRFVNEKGEVVEGVLAVVQENAEDGTTVAVTPGGQVLQISTAEGETFQLLQEAEETTETNDESPAAKKTKLQK